jgi:hypothetical protein
MRIITTILSLAISLVVGFIVMMFRICLAGGGGGGGTGSASTTFRSGTSAKRIPREVRIDNRWYTVRGGGGELELWGAMIAYRAKELDPLARPNFYTVREGSGFTAVGTFDTVNGTCSGSVTGLR